MRILIVNKYAYVRGGADRYCATLTAGSHRIEYPSHILVEGLNGSNHSIKRSVDLVRIGSIGIAIPEISAPGQINF